ncbi:MAG: hypothetical protein QOD99_1718 [Chthoniobacter sp.]|jgi:uncharacterized membrane protein YdbT with pleckstrin-like domain|nr:hypothetical protein [Chthoniobacter sp.]
MPEQPVWSGSPSQVKNLGAFVFSALLALAMAAAALFFWQWPPGVALVLLPLCYAFWKWLVIRSQRFELTTERLLLSRGVFSRTTDTLELYRVKDMRIVQPFSLRLFGLENIDVVTSDATSREIVLDHVPSTLRLGDKLREYVEACRVAKGTREVELE